MLIRLSYFLFYLTNLVNQDWFYLIDSQIMVNRDRISIIVAMPCFPSFHGGFHYLLSLNWFCLTTNN
jgi:hypothetical protein